MDNTNVLNEDFLNTFMSLYRVQFIMGCCRIHTSNRRVAPPTLLEKCFTILCILLTLGSVYAVIVIYFEVISDKSVTILGISVLISICATSFCNVAHVRFSNARQNVEFHAKMQKLDTFMKLNKCNINTTLKRANTVLALLVLTAFVLLVVVIFVTQQFKALCFLGTALCLLSFLLELIVCSSIVVYIFVRVKFVNYLMDSYLKQNDNSKPIVEAAFVKCISFMARDTNNNFATSEVHSYLKEIFSCFEAFQNLYRFQLLLFCIKLVVLSLISFEMLLYTMSKNIYSPIQVAGLIVFMIIDSLMAAFLAFRFGVFFAEVKETKRLCIAVLAVHQEGALREKAKTMLNMVEETPPSFSVYEMWDINAGIFVTIFSLVTSLIVTLIQFAFL